MAAPSAAVKATRPAKAGGAVAGKVHAMDVLDFLRSFARRDSFGLIIVDPPYNIGKNFGNNTDNMPLAEYVEWSLSYLRECMRLIKPAAPVYMYGLPEILAHIAVHFAPDNQRWLAWHYTNKTVASSRFWQRSYESILCLWKGGKPRLNIDAIREDYSETFLKNSAGKPRKSKQCRYSRANSLTLYKAHDNGALPRDVIKVPALAGGAGSKERMAYCKDCRALVAGKARHEHGDCRLISHPTQKPLHLTERLIKGSMPESVLIPFAGSGSECYMAKKMGVNFYAADINPEYVRLANQWIKTA